MERWAIVESGKPLAHLTGETPQPKGAEVVVAVSHCGVCHSDLHLMKGEYNLGHGKVMRLSDRGVELPRAPGHEVIGRVAAVGPEASGVAVGDLRIVYPWIGCGECPRCASGNDNLCAKQASIGVLRDGGFSSHVVVPHPRYLIDPGNIDPALAATFACSGITVLSAIRQLGDLTPDEPVLLIGGGGLGHAALSMLKALGHRAAILVDIDPAKRAAALSAGATAVVDGQGSPEEVVARIHQAAGGPVLHAIDFVNNSNTARTGFDALGKGGRLVLVGIAGGELDISLASMIFTARTVIGTNTGSLQDLRDVVALAQAGKLQPIPVETVPFTAANDAVQRLKKGDVIGRLILDHGQKA